MNNDILIMGKGFIGERLAKELGCRVSEKFIYTIKDIDEVFEEHTPKTVINCIGYVGKNNVDDCEKDKDATLQANTFVPLLLAEAAVRKGIKLVHISSGCIYHYDYDNPRLITEKDIPDYFDLYYSRTKIYAERALLPLSEKHNILMARIRIPLDDRPFPKNILDKLISYKNVIDIPNSVTYIPDFVDALKYLIDIDAKGIFNVVNKGALRYPQLMEVYKKYVTGFNYKILPLSEFNLKRTNLMLSTEKLERTGFKVRDINEVLDECVQNYLEY